MRLSHFISVNILLFSLFLCISFPVHAADDQSMIAGEPILISSILPSEEEAVLREYLRRQKVEQRTNANSRRYAPVIPIVIPINIPNTEEEEEQSTEITILSDSIGSLSRRSRLICRVRNRFNDPNVLAITKQRMVERLSEKLLIDEDATASILQSIRFCETILGEEYPYLFYAGSDSIGKEPLVAPIEAPLPVILPYEPFSPPVPGVKTQETDVELEPTEEDLEKKQLSAEAKLRTLCRVQQRGSTNQKYFEHNIGMVASQFAERWNIDQSTIADVLLNNDLCDNPDTRIIEDAMLPPKEVKPTDPIIVEKSSEEVIKTEDGNGIGATLNSFVNNMKKVPMMILIVGGLALITFLVLVILILIPFFQKK